MQDVLIEGSSANTQRLYGIDISPNVDINTVFQIMEEYEKNGVWVFEEGHYCERNGNSIN